MPGLRARRRVSLLTAIDREALAKITPVNGGAVLRADMLRRQGAYVS